MSVDQLGHPSLPSGPPRKWAGKYDTPDELERGHDNLQSTLTERNQRIQELERALQEQQEVWSERVNPMDRARAREEQRDPYDVLGQIGVDPTAVEAIAERAVQRFINPLIQGQQARQMISQEYPDFVQMENEVAQFIESSPDLKNRYRQLYQTDPAAAMEWGITRFQRSREKSTDQAARHDAGLPAAGGAIDRSGTVADQSEALQKAFEFGQRYGDWSHYTHMRLNEDPRFAAHTQRPPGF